MADRMVDNWQYPPSQDWETPSQEHYWTYDSTGYNVNGFQIIDPTSNQNIEEYFYSQLKELKKGFIPYGDAMRAFLQKKQEEVDA